MAKFALWSPFFLENWDFNTPLYRGIGGSETSQVEVAQRLAKRGHEVISYAPLGHEGTTYQGVRWRNSEAPGELPDGCTWIVYRDINFFDRDLPKGKFLFCAQDTFYDWTPVRLAKVNWYLCLCRKHCAETENRHPELKGRIVKWSNSIRRDLIEEIEKEVIVRNPKRLTFASSPDRGLLTILQDWYRVREQVPDAEFHVFYGLNNAETIIKRGGGEHLKPLIAELKELLKQPGVVWRGRIPQIELIREWFKTGIFYSPSDWPETSMISIMESSACGAIPVANNFWAQGENCLNGVLVDGIPQQDELCRYTMLYELMNLLKHPEEQEKIRPAVIEDSRDSFNYEKWIKVLEELSVKEI